MDDTNKSNCKKIVESLLFAYGEPLGIASIANCLEISNKEATMIIEELKNDYDYNMRGFCIIKTDDKYRLTTRSEYFEYIRRLLKRAPNATLSQAALETLSIIAYKQPVSRTEIEFLRGVQSSSSLDLLIDKGLVRAAGKLEAPGRPTAFETTDEFLRLMNITSLNELAQYESFSEGIQMKLSELETEVSDS